jgi:hypothetical protein
MAGGGGQRGRGQSKGLGMMQGGCPKRLSKCASLVLSAVRTGVVRWLWWWGKFLRGLVSVFLGHMSLGRMAKSRGTLPDSLVAFIEDWGTRARTHTQLLLVKRQLPGVLPHTTTIPDGKPTRLQQAAVQT